MYEKQITNIYCYLFLYMADYPIKSGIHLNLPFKRLYSGYVGSNENRCTGFE